MCAYVNEMGLKRKTVDDIHFKADSNLIVSDHTVGEKSC